MTHLNPPGVRFLASIGFALVSLLSGCSDNSTTSARFTQSATPQAPGLVKLVSAGSSGSRALVHVMLFGPERDLDLFAFRFGIEIGNANLVSLVAQSSYVQTTLTTGAGQTIGIDVNDSDPSVVKINVEKLGGGAGNGTAAAATTILELAFDVRGTGTTTLTLVGLGANPPEAIDSAGLPIGAVTFDAAAAGIAGVTTGGGY